MSLASYTFLNLRSGQFLAPSLASRAGLRRVRPSIPTGAFISQTVGQPTRGKSLIACTSQGEPEYFPASTSKEEWLKVDEKVNVYPSQRTFKAIGTAGSDSEEFVSSILNAVEEAGDQAVLKKTQVTQRPSRNGRYLAVSVSNIHVESGEQVYGICIHTTTYTIGSNNGLS